MIAYCVGAVGTFTAFHNSKNSLSLKWTLLCPEIGYYGEKVRLELAPLS